MPNVFRLVKEKHLDTPLAGGSARRGERWNPAGVDVLYTSSSPELALVEVLAGLMPIRFDELPRFYLITIVLPDTEAIRVYQPSDLPPGWNAPVRPPACQAFFGTWLEGMQELTVSIPSAVVAFSANFVIHRAHLAFSQVEVASIQPFTVDGRLTVPVNYGPV